MKKLRDIVQIDELSKGKLGQYVVKAAQSKHNLGVESGQSADKSRSSAFKKSQKRTDGIATAVSKMTGIGKMKAQGLDHVFKDSKAKVMATEEKTGRPLKSILEDADAIKKRGRPKKKRNLAGEIIDESVEQLDELSKTKLGQYVKKAGDDRAKSSAKAMIAVGTRNASQQFSHEERADKRKAGIAKAVDKLTK